MRIENKPFNINHKAGLTKQFKQEIQKCEIKDIERVFYLNEVQSNFRSNKTIAWCCMKCLEIFKKLNLPLPNLILVENFKSIGKNIYCTGINNVAPTLLSTNSNIIIPEKTLIFNSNPKTAENKTFSWENINEEADSLYYRDLAPTKHFLYVFLHEFVHSAHEQNLIDNLGGIKTLEFYDKAMEKNYCDKFLFKYNKIFQDLSSYALTNPFEAIACHLSKMIVENLDNDLNINMSLQDNPIYKKLSTIEKIIGIRKNFSVNNVLRRCWHGKNI